MALKVAGWTWLYPDGERKRTQVLRQAEESCDSTWPPNATQGKLIALVQKLYPQGHISAEIALLIGEGLTAGSLARLAAVNHEFHELASEILYHTVRIDLRGGKGDWTMSHKGCFRYLHLLSTLVTSSIAAARIRRFILHVGYNQTTQGENLVNNRRKVMKNKIFKLRYTEASTKIQKRLGISKLPSAGVAVANYVMIEQLAGVQYLELNAVDFGLRRWDAENSTSIIRQYLTEVRKRGRHPNLQTALLSTRPAPNLTSVDLSWPRARPPFGGWVNEDGSGAEGPSQAQRDNWYEYQAQLYKGPGYH